MLSIDTDYAILSLANEAVGHPFYLVYELEVVFADTANGVLVHVFNPFDIGRVLMLIQIEKRQKHFEGHDDFAPVGRFATDDVA